MTNENNDIRQLLQDQSDQNEAIIEQVVESLKTVFTEEAQHEVIAELYSKLFLATQQIEELNLQGIFLSSYIDAFYVHLVGEDKLISSEAYKETARQAYEDSIKAVAEASRELQKESE